MRFTWAALLGACALATPVVDQKFCQVETIIISALKQQAAATQYCSGVLHITPVTKTITSTASQAPVKTNKTVTVVGPTITKQVTQLSTVLITVTPTVTVNVTTTSHVPQTCLSSGTSAGLAPRATSVVAPKPSVIPTKWGGDLISKACSCLSLPTSTTTTRVITTLPQSTIVSTVPVTTNPVTTKATIVVTSITTSASISTITLTKTVTVTDPPVSQPTANGLNWYLYDNPFSDSIPDSLNSAYFKRAVPLARGQLENIDFASNDQEDDYSLTLGNYTVEDSQYRAVVMQGFFLPKTTGTYTFTTDGNIIDNWGYAWFGTNAYQAWDNSNTNYQASRLADSRGVLFLTSGEYSVRLTAGDQVPVTFLWANARLAGVNNFVVTAPDGTNVSDTTGLFIQPCDGGAFQP